jgi:hypothetical protein
MDNKLSAKLNGERQAFATEIDDGLTKREFIAAILFAGLLANPTTFAKKEESWLSSEGDSDGGDDQIPSDEAAILWADSLLEKLGKTQ